MAAPVDDISAFIIAGGMSRRFGRDKSLYPLGGVPLIEHVIAALKTTFGRIAIIADECDKFSYLDLPCYPDLTPGLGPIGGLYTALSRSETDLAFMVATDMPYLSPELMLYMASLAGDYDLVVPCVGGYYEALHAVYSKRCLPLIKSWIDSGERQIVGFYDKADVRIIVEKEIARLADISLVFKNINYLEDLPDNG